MSCPSWGHASTEDEVRLLVGPAAVLGTILAAIARGIRPEGMAVGTRGRRTAIAGAGVVAVVSLISMTLGIYANEACVDTIVVGRTGDAEVTLLQMFWMLVPGVATAAIASSMCNLVATKLSLPIRTEDGWKVSHIPFIVQNGVVSPRDDYGIGVGTLRRFSSLWCLGCGAWVFVTAVMVYIAARGDLTNGLLNLAGLIAVATNTGIPVWNASQTGSGQDSKSKNVDLIRTVETNVVGIYYDNVAAVTTTVPSKDTIGGAPMVLGRTQQYIVSNAHATIADYRGEEMDTGRFASKNETNSAAAIAVGVVNATLATTKKLSRVLTEAESGGEEVERMTLSAYMCTIAADEAWAGKTAQRRRLLAVSMAIAWALKITGGLGGKSSRTEESLQVRHKAETCSCCLHRWTVSRPLKATANEEMGFMFGSSGHLPQIKKGKEEFAASVWEHLRENMGTRRNRGLLLYYWCMAMLDNAMLESYSTMDYFPQASIKVQAFTPEDFKIGCSNTKGLRDTWVPSVTSQGASPIPLQTCEVDDVELKATVTQGRHRLYPHPKTIDHIARRTLYRGTVVQAVIWTIQGMRGLFSG